MMMNPRGFVATYQQAEICSGSNEKQQATLFPITIPIHRAAVVQGWIVDIRPFDTVASDGPSLLSNLVHSKPQPAENSVKK